MIKNCSIDSSSLIEAFNFDGVNKFVKYFLYFLESQITRNCFVLGTNSHLQSSKFYSI